jgi:hypothetical protein
MYLLNVTGKKKSNRITKILTSDVRFLWNSIGEERLPGIALLNIEKNFEIDLDQIVTFYCKKRYKENNFLK